ncbi:TPA: 23S rRNA (adenine(2503)-C(2))-methyltransferase RlmN [Candidatus Latescibacteria bacterium]|nr:23S rRNA (adenine(2503)-C(2))-methyltransferase RlmN [Rhodospirillaceae bacterium]HAA77130.1 23S rRNA (adenine(2503)-C(2))-methyltransferase RlmN [Candidatus Latescibacterota bacterium]
MVVKETKTEIKGLLPADLEDTLAEHGFERFRGRQIAHWMYGRGTTDFQEMTNLSLTARDELAERMSILNLGRVTTEEASDGSAIKFLFEMPDGRRIESVLMREGRRRTLCVSSQVGCPLDCSFCATGKMGLLRNLTPGEIIDQVIQARKYLTNRGDDLTNVVMMGMGEPLLNLDAVTVATHLMNLDYGPSISNRRITVSTAGHVPGIHKLIDNGQKVMLAVSLNATTDALRDEIMPINKRWPIKDLLKAASDYQVFNGRRITFEYVLLGGVNDTVEEARALVKLLHRIPSKVNVIPWNPIDGEDYERPDERTIHAFVQAIADAQMTVTVRYSKGTEITAGCGQLYQKFERN